MRFFGKLALGGLLTFLLLEIVLRVAKPRELQYYRDLKVLHAYHPDYLVSLAPDIDLYIRHHAGLWEGRFTTNSLGFRASPEPGNEPMIGCLGDSATMGFGVSDEETYCRILDGMELGGVRYRTMNMAVDAFGSMGSAKRLDDVAGRVKFKTVLFFVSPNDFFMMDDLRARGVLSDDETDTIRETNPGLLKYFRLQFELTRASYALMAAKLSVEQLLLKWIDTRNSVHSELWQAGFPVSTPAQRGKSERGFGRYIHDSYFMDKPRPICSQETPGRGTVEAAHQCPVSIPASVKCEAREPRPGDLPPLLDITKRAYDRMLESARRNGFRLIVVIPTIQNVDIYCSQHGLYSPLYEYGLRAAAYFRAQGVPVIDLRSYTPEMCGEKLVLRDGVVKYTVPDDYYIGGDGHYTAIGNQWAARAVRRELIKLAAKNAF